MRWEIEELARIALEQADLGGPVDPYTLAKRRGLRVLDGGPGCEGILVGRRIIVDVLMRPPRRAFVVAHELAHHILREAKIDDTEAVANYLAAAILMPRFDIEADFRRWGWDVLRIVAKYRHASFEAVARRIVALRDARACVFDKPLQGQAAPSMYVVPWDGPPPSREERAAARAAVEHGAPIEFRSGLVAWPVLEWDWHRVITVANT